MNGNNSSLAEAKRYFPDTVYGELLVMDKSTQLKDIIKHTQKFVEEKGRGITTSQLRNIFAKVKPEQNHLAIQLVRPQLAYVAARQKTDDAKVMIALFDDLINCIDTPAHLKGFKTFMESVIAYHKYYHPKSN